MSSCKQASVQKHRRTHTHTHAHALCLIYIYTNWNTWCCRVNKVIKMYLVLVPRRHPLSPVATHCHPLYPVVTYCCLLPLVLTCYHPSAPVTTRCHLLSPVTTPLDELTLAYAYCCIPFFMDYMPLKIIHKVHTSILINKKVVKRGNLRLSAPQKGRFTGH